MDKQVPDSAGTATAYLTGVKANYETIGVNARVNSSETNCDHIRANAVDSIMETARRAGKVIGLVTTTRMYALFFSNSLVNCGFMPLSFSCLSHSTHATPAASYAHVAHRDWEYDAAMPVQTRADGCRDIAYQLINREPGNSFRVIFGGGRRNFKPISPGANKTADAYRTDGVDLIEQWKANRRAAGLKSEQFAYVQTRDEMAQLDNDKIEFAFGLFDDDHVVYHAQRDQKPDEPTLTQMAVKAVQMLSRHKQGFVLLIEGGRIDHAHHENHAVLAIEDMVELDRAIGQVLKLVDREETLSVVTADHSHTFIINGYPRRGNSIYGNTGYGESKTNKSFTTLMYGNGPGHKNPRPDSRLEDTGKQRKFALVFYEM